MAKWKFKEGKSLEDFPHCGKSGRVIRGQLALHGFVEVDEIPENYKSFLEEDGAVVAPKKSNKINKKGDKKWQ